MKTTSTSDPGVSGLVDGVGISEEPRPQLKPFFDCVIRNVHVRELGNGTAGWLFDVYRES